MRRVPAIAPALLALAAAVACTDPHLLSGTYRSTQPLRLPGAPETDTLYLVLDLRHFGPEVGGVVRFSTRPDQVIQPTNGCACRYVAGGVAKSEGETVASSQYTLTFQFREPRTPCPADEADVPVIGARLVSDDTGDTLSGQLFLDGEELGSEDWVFTRFLEAEDLPERIDECADDQVGP